MAGVRITGLKETIRSLEKLGVSVEDLKGAMQKVSAKSVSDAKALTPVLTGRLAASIRSSKAKNKAVIRAGNNSTTKYASFVEFGSIHNEETAMVRDAVTSNEAYTVQALDQEVQSLIRQYGLD